LCQISGYSAFTLKNIKNYWLDRTPEESINCSGIQYVVFDATYFHKDGCMLNLMDATNQRILSHRYVKKESFRDAYPWFISLKQVGLDPKFVTTDGHQSIIRAIQLAWPQAKVQRCLYHIQHEGMRWLRSYPKTEAGKDLRTILSRLSRVKSIQDRDNFIHNYRDWLNKYESLVASLPRTTIAYKDLQRTIILINNALPDMFYFIEDSNIHSTTNALEGFHSRLKADYLRHRGLSKEHKISYLRWYCYFKNIP
jgi:transposase-like protein